MVVLSRLNGIRLARSTPLDEPGWPRLLFTNMAFVQFQRCDICCKNHNAGSKHIYSQCHSSNVTKICKKFKDKVRTRL